MRCSPPPPLPPCLRRPRPWASLSPPTQGADQRAADLGCDPQTVRKWRNRFLEQRIDGVAHRLLADAPAVGVRAVILEVGVFVLKQAWACIFGAALLASRSPAVTRERDSAVG